MHFVFAPTTGDWTRWGISAGIFAGFLLLAFASKFILTSVIGAFTRKTKTILDDLIIKALTAPVFALLVAGGLWIALTNLSELDKIEDIIHKVFTIIFIGIFTVALVKVVHALLEWYGTEVATRTASDIDDKLVPVFRRIADVIIYILAFLVMLGRLGWDIGPYLAGLGIGGLAVALALQPTLSNFLSGTYVISDSIIRKGHYIMLDNGTEGNIEDIGWRTTKIRTWQGNLVIMPNSRLSDAIVTDYERPDESMAFSIDCGVSYNSNLQQVEKITLEVARNLMQTNPVGVKDFEPVLRFKQFGDSNINFSVVMKGIDRPAQFVLKHEFIKQLHARFQQEGIDIEYPVRKLLFGNNLPK
ncbi:MAG: mechanosensitive ion channel family protein [Dehalococcoidales bacterium]|nr:mechanosensitive ion channel family protein [Dehalococcoidales bacterium]